MVGERLAAERGRQDVDDGTARRRGSSPRPARSRCGRDESRSRCERRHRGGRDRRPRDLSQPAALPRRPARICARRTGRAVDRRRRERPAHRHRFQRHARLRSEPDLGVGLHVFRGRRQDLRRRRAVAFARATRPSARHCSRRCSAIRRSSTSAIACSSIRPSWSARKSGHGSRADHGRASLDRLRQDLARAVRSDLGDQSERPLDDGVRWMRRTRSSWTSTRTRAASS